MRYVYVRVPGIPWIPWPAVEMICYRLASDCPFLAASLSQAIQAPTRCCDSAKPPQDTWWCVKRPCHTTALLLLFGGCPGSVLVLNPTFKFFSWELRTQPLSCGYRSPWDCACLSNISGWASSRRIPHTTLGLHPLLSVFSYSNSSKLTFAGNFSLPIFSLIDRSPIQAGPRVSNVSGWAFRMRIPHMMFALHLLLSEAS